MYLDVGLSEDKGYLFCGPYIEDLTVQGTILGSPIFGNPHVETSDFCPVMLP